MPDPHQTAAAPSRHPIRPCQRPRRPRTSRARTHTHTCTNVPPAPALAAAAPTRRSWPAASRRTSRPWPASSWPPPRSAMPAPPATGRRGSPAARRTTARRHARRPSAWPTGAAPAPARRGPSRRLKPMPACLTRTAPAGRPAALLLLEGKGAGSRHQLLPARAALIPHCNQPRPPPTAPSSPTSCCCCCCRSAPPAVLLRAVAALCSCSHPTPLGLDAAHVVAASVAWLARQAPGGLDCKPAGLLQGLVTDVAHTSDMADKLRFIRSSLFQASARRWRPAAPLRNRGEGGVARACALAASLGLDRRCAPCTSTGDSPPPQHKPTT